MSLLPLDLANSNVSQVTTPMDIIERHAECSICMATLYNAASCTPCLHTFCAGCIVQWIEKNKTKCPLCRVSVLDLSPNWVLRDMVDSYLQVKPELQRTKEEKTVLDKAELGYTVKWIGSTDSKLLYVESLATLRSAPEKGDQKYAVMKNRAVELFKKLLSSEGKEVPIDVLKRGMDKLIEDVNKDVFPAKVFLKYHRLERAYMYMVRISLPILGPSEHSSFGNQCFETGNLEDTEEDSDDFDEDDEFDLNLSGRIDEALNEVRNPETVKPPRESVGGFDPADLEALARVQNMTAPGFIRRRHRNFAFASPQLVNVQNERRPGTPHVIRSANRRANIQEPIVPTANRSSSVPHDPSSSAIPGASHPSNIPIPLHPRRSARLAARNGGQH